jgi:hypothetical protein
MKESLRKSFKDEDDNLIVIYFLTFSVEKL